MINKALLLAAVACAVPALCASQETKAPAKSAAPPAAAIDVLDRPAQMTPLAARRLLQSVARAGDRLVGVGPRGHIVVSADGGATWKQSVVPVSSDLTAVYFVNDKNGWAVGHDGVVLATTDGGESWVKQLDGRAANGLLLKTMEARVCGRTRFGRAEGAARRSRALSWSRDPTSPSSTSGSRTRRPATSSGPTT